MDFLKHHKEPKEWNDENEIKYKLVLTIALSKEDYSAFKLFQGTIMADILIDNY